MYSCFFDLVKHGVLTLVYEIRTIDIFATTTTTTTTTTAAANDDDDDVDVDSNNDNNNIFLQHLPYGRVRFTRKNP